MEWYTPEELIKELKTINEHSNQFEVYDVLRFYNSCLLSAYDDLEKIHSYIQAYREMGGGIRRNQYYPHALVDLRICHMELNHFPYKNIFDRLTEEGLLPTDIETFSIEDGYNEIGDVEHILMQIADIFILYKKDMNAYRTATEKLADMRGYPEDKGALQRFNKTVIAGSKWIEKCKELDDFYITNDVKKSKNTLYNMIDDLHNYRKEFCFTYPYKITNREIKAALKKSDNLTTIYSVVKNKLDDAISKNTKKSGDNYKLNKSNIISLLGLKPLLPEDRKISLNDYLEETLEIHKEEYQRMLNDNLAFQYENRLYLVLGTALYIGLIDSSSIEHYLNLNGFSLENNIIFIGDLTTKDIKYYIDNDIGYDVLSLILKTQYKNGKKIRKEEKEKKKQQKQQNNQP